MAGLSIARTLMAATLFGAASVVAVQPAAASITILECTDLADGVESNCHMQPNIVDGSGSPYNYEIAEDVYNDWAASNGAGSIDLQLLGAFSPGELSNSLGSITNDGSSGTFNLAGYDVDFVAVKSSDEFWIFELVGDSSTGTWIVPDGQDMSHLLLFGSPGAIPEPTVWAMMLLGVGAIGSQIRRRRRQSGLARVTA